MLISVVACGTTPATQPSDATSGGETEAPADSNVKLPAPAYDGVFKTGYARAVIHPTYPQELLHE